jgi:hypothetical protein
LFSIACGKSCNRTCTTTITTTTTTTTAPTTTTTTTTTQAGITSASCVDFNESICKLLSSSCTSTSYINNKPFKEVNIFYNLVFLLTRSPDFFSR